MPPTNATRRWPRPSRCSTVPATPWRSSTVTTGNGQGPVGRPTATAGRPSPASRPKRRSVDPQVVEEHPVDPALGGQPPVAGRLGLVVVPDDLEDQRAVPLGQQRLHPGQELGEERVGPEQLRHPPHHQSDRERPRPRQRPCPGARLPPQLTGRGQDPVPGLGRHPRPAVERERHRPLGHPGPPGHIDDRRPTPGRTWASGPPPAPFLGVPHTRSRAAGPCGYLAAPSINRFSLEIRGYPRTLRRSAPGGADAADLSEASTSAFFLCLPCWSR